jgi:hypothetical protein
MVVALAIAAVWLLLALGCYCVLWFQNRRPLSQMDRLCTRIDLALMAQHGEPSRRFVRESDEPAQVFALRR